jgi:signal transduction histidine kinase
MAWSHQSLQLYDVLAAKDPARAAEKLELARESTRRALDQTRSLAAELRNMHQEELENGLPAALEALARSSVPDRVHVEVAFPSGAEGGWEDIPAPVGLQVYLVMREALTNAVRHSGCEHVMMSLEIRDRELAGAVEDDGGGFDPEAAGKASLSGGVGLRSMRERVGMLGGSLRVDSAPGAGTKVELRVPIGGRR